MDYTEYAEASITNIKTNRRYPGVVYAQIRSKDGSLLVSATLEYCKQRMQEAAFNEFQNLSEKVNG